VPRYSAALAILSAALFGAAAPVGKRLLADLPVFQLAGLLYLGAAIGVAPAALRHRGAGLLPRGRAGALRLLGAIAFGGVLGPVLLLSGLRLASAASVSLWLNLELVATAILGVAWFRDRLGALGWIGTAGVTAACAALSFGEGPAGLAAGALVAAACVCWALDNHWTALLDGLPATASTWWKGAIAGAVDLSIGLAAETWRAPASAVALALALGALSYGASIALYITAAHGLGATRAQLVFASAPFFGVGLAAAQGEVITPLEAAAAAGLLASLALVFRDRHAHFHRHAPLAHVHVHSHDDGHHLHGHPGKSASLRHSHWHEHAPLAHAHPHWPDLHHRHSHADEP
jgi:drug/metabolite transporter (DMT)-like permease